MADIRHSAFARQVPILTIDRMPSMDSSLQQTRIITCPPIHLQLIKRVRHPLQKLNFSHQGERYSGSGQQQELKLLATSVFKQRQPEDPVSLDEEQVTCNILPEMQGVTMNHPRNLPVLHPCHGRLLKARLMPLRPVNIKGPTVAECQGMIPERIQNNPALDGLRKLQDQIFGHPYCLMQSLRTSETLHRASIASLVVPNDD
ncbi:uncharacterized protein O3C94_016610 [Discoglossus pictus]